MKVFKIAEPLPSVFRLNCDEGSGFWIGKHSGTGMKEGRRGGARCRLRNGGYGDILRQTEIESPCHRPITYSGFYLKEKRRDGVGETLQDHS